jgi:hypothetical protein
MKHGTTRSLRGWLRLITAAGVIFIIWTVVLPSLARQESIRAWGKLLDEHEVDPAAMFYTDLKAMSRIEERVAATRRNNPSAFWTSGQAPARPNTPSNAERK